MKVDPNNKKVIHLYLESHQIRMVKGFLGIDCDGIEIPINDPGLVMYRVADNKAAQKVLKKMYLKDWQKLEIKDETGLTCDFIELTKALNHFRYGVPTE